MYTTCRLCGQPALYTTGYCRTCIEATRESARCFDCASVVTIAIAEGDAVMRAFIEHDDTCPTWQAMQTEAAP